MNKYTISKYQVDLSIIFTSNTKSMEFELPHFFSGFFENCDFAPKKGTEKKSF